MPAGEATLLFSFLPPFLWQSTLKIKNLLLGSNFFSVDPILEGIHRNKQESQELSFFDRR